MNTDILQNLKDKGHKITKVRSALVEILGKTSTPLSITELITKLKSHGLNPNKTTVYREIEFLNKLGVAEGVDFGEGKKRYESSADHHHHIICVNCKKVTDIHMEKDIESFNAKIAKDAGYKPAGHSLEFFGLCENCQGS